jgi:hypothetical protein
VTWRWSTPLPEADGDAGPPEKAYERHIGGVEWEFKPSRAHVHRRTTLERYV